MFQTTNQYSSNILGTVVPNFGFLGGPKSARPSFLVTPVSPSFLESKVAGKPRNRENPQLNERGGKNHRSKWAVFPAMFVSHKTPLETAGIYIPHIPLHPMVSRPTVAEKNQLFRWSSLWDRILKIAMI
jgi:hypothetical protein